MDVLARNSDDDIDDNCVFPMITMMKIHVYTLCDKASSDDIVSRLRNVQMENCASISGDGRSLYLSCLAETHTSNPVCSEIYFSGYKEFGAEKTLPHISEGLNGMEVYFHCPVLLRHVGLIYLNI
jgi:hypothetical protein